MKSLFYIIVVFICVSDTLFASTIKLIKPNQAIRLIGKSNVVFVSSDTKKEYEQEHIVNALNIYMNPKYLNKRLSCPPLYYCPEDMHKYLEKKGINSNQTLIVYERKLDANATGVYSFLESFGFEEIYLLDGGLNAIKSLDPNQKLFNTLYDEYISLKEQIAIAKKSHETKKEQSLTSDTEGIFAKMRIIKPNLLIRGGDEKIINKGSLKLSDLKINLTYITDSYDVKRASEDIQKDANKSQYIIIDARSTAEFQGRKKLEGIVRSGHIPGAIHIASTEITDFINRRSFQTIERMQKIFDQENIKKDTTIYTYSNYGIGRGAHIAAALRLLGYKNVKIFTGGWSSWGNDTSLAIVKEDTI